MLSIWRSIVANLTPNSSFAPASLYKKSGLIFRTSLSAKGEQKQSKGKVETTENKKQNVTATAESKVKRDIARCEGHMDRGMQREAWLVRHSGLGGVMWSGLDGMSWVKGVAMQAHNRLHCEQ